MNSKINLKLERSDFSMIVLSGGIGNQLFQYCLAREIEEHIAAPVYLDYTLLSLSHRSSNQRRSIHRINHGPIHKRDVASLADFLICRTSIRISNHLVQKYSASIEGIARDKAFQVFKQSNKLYDEKIVPALRAIYLGSFTSHKYWAHNFSKFTTDIGIALQEYGSNVGHNSEAERPHVTIHARRGDYVNNPKTRSVHGVYGMEYYLKALSEYKVSTYETVSILSDDSGFARGLKSAITARFKGLRVTVSTEQDPLVLLNSHSHSQLLIGSNSTFSWWLANLGEDKIRVMPSRWFVKDDYGFNPEDYFPCDTELLDAPFEYI